MELEILLVVLFSRTANFKFSCKSQLEKEAFEEAEKVRRAKEEEVINNVLAFPGICHLIYQLFLAVISECLQIGSSESKRRR